MTETLGSATSAVRGATRPLSGVAQSEVADRLKVELLREYLAAQATRLLTGAGRSALELGASRTKDSVTEALKNLGGGKGKSVVSFHRLADNVTRVLLVVEYYPQGLFEKTGNLWRAHGEVVRSHEDAVAEEDEEAYEGEEEEDGDAAYAEEENGEYPDEDTEEAESEYEPEADVEEEPEDESEEESEGEAEYAGGGSRR